MRFLAVTALLTISFQVFAHHGHSMYDFGKEISLQGTVTNVRWTNPHVHFELETPVEGERAIWVIEAEPPALMSKFGWTSDSVSAGDTITINGIPARNPDRKMAIGVSADLASGTRLWITGRVPYEEYAEDLPDPFYASSLSGNWITQLNPEVIEKFVHRTPSPALTEAGNAPLEAHDDTIPNPGLECVHGPVPYMSLVPVLTRIELGETVTRIRVEADGEQGVVERIVYMNLDSHEGATPTNHGHSIGRWDGDVLVIDTTHFAASPFGGGSGLPSSPERHLVERFELNPDGTSLSYTFWIEDPEYLAEPETATLRLLYRPDLKLQEVPCDLESARQYLQE